MKAFKENRFTENLISLFKYALAIFMMLIGVLTCIGPLTPMDGALGYIYSTRASLIIFGVIFFVCGAMLLYGKVRRSRKWTGLGLFYIFICFLFATLLNAVAYSFAPGYYLGNLVFTIVVGALWLRWKLKTEYINPKHFIAEIKELT